MLVGGGADFVTAFMLVGRNPPMALLLLILAVRAAAAADVLFGWTALVFMLTSSWLISSPRYLLVLYTLFSVGARLSRFPAVLAPLVLAGARSKDG
jgi:hypothetical protein